MCAHVSRVSRRSPLLRLLELLLFLLLCVPSTARLLQTGAYIDPIIYCVLPDLSPLIVRPCVSKLSFFLIRAFAKTNTRVPETDETTGEHHEQQQQEGSNYQAIFLLVDI